MECEEPWALELKKIVKFFSNFMNILWKFEFLFGFVPWIVQYALV